MPTYAFSCGCGWRTEQRAGYETVEVECPVCSAPAPRESVYRVNATGFAIPPMRERPVPISRFVEAQGEMVRHAEVSGVPAPDVLTMAKRQASQIRRHAPELITGT